MSIALNDRIEANFRRSKASWCGKTMGPLFRLCDCATFLGVITCGLQPVGRDCSFEFCFKAVPFKIFFPSQVPRESSVSSKLDQFDRWATTAAKRSANPLD